jgi:methionine-rich copper-binding protein CopC
VGLTGRRPSPVRAAAAFAGGLVVVFATLVAAAAPASAHTRLLSSTPADGAVVPTAPDQITLLFAQHLLGLGAVAVEGPDGCDVTSGAAVLDGATVTQRLASYRPAGRYTLSYRIVSADGHPVASQVTFTATGGVGSASAAGSSAGTSGDQAGATAPSGAACGKSGGKSGSSTGTTVGIVVGAGALIAVTGAVVAILARRRRQGSTDES